MPSKGTYYSRLPIKLPTPDFYRPFFLVECIEKIEISWWSTHAQHLQAFANTTVICTTRTWLFWRYWSLQLHYGWRTRRCCLKVKIVCWISNEIKLTSGHKKSLLLLYFWPWESVSFLVTLSTGRRNGGNCKENLRLNSIGYGVYGLVLRDQS